MGYYSEVSIVLHKEDYDKLISLAKNKLPNFESGDCLLNDPVKYYKRDGKVNVYLHWNCIKWYVGYFSEVTLINDFLKEHEHCFIRIGEELGDFECDLNDDAFGDVIGVRAEIAVDSYYAEKFTDTP